MVPLPSAAQPIRSAGTEFPLADSEVQAAGPAAL